MSKKRRNRYYPSSRNNGVIETPQNPLASLEITPPFRLKDELPNQVFNEWKNRFKDEWINNVANLNDNNSIAQFTNFTLKRLSYAECANLAIDTIMIKAYTTITNEIFNKGGEFKITTAKVEKADEIINQLENELIRLDFWSVFSHYVSTSLIYGTSFLYIQTPKAEIDKPLYFDYKTMSASSNMITRLKVVEPWSVGIAMVESANPLAEDYMTPTKWFVGGYGEVHTSRFIPLSFFKVPDLIKPIFNYGGVSLLQLMKDYVKDAEGIRMSLADLFLRFRSMIIKSPKVRNDLEGAKTRAKALAEQKNNIGVMLLTDNEEYQETITPITGLDRIQSQSYENMCIASQIPATKLLGISPSGFNATGEYDLANYYDTIGGFQNNIVKPLLLDIAQMIVWNLGFDVELDFEFAPLQKQNQKELAEIDNLNADYLTKLSDLGMITSDQAFDIAKQKGMIPENMRKEEAEENLLDPVEELII